MKLTRVEQVFDGSRLIFYFTAEARVDFRELVRELAAEFHTRIEMRQIGVRDEAKMLGGYGTCGRPLCCTTFLTVVRAGVDQDGEAAGPEPQPVEAVRPVRPAEVLPALRAAERQRRQCTAAAASEGGCDNPIGLRQRRRLRRRCGAAACGCGSLRSALMRHDPASRSPSAIPPASVRRSRREAAADPRVLDVCEPILYGAADRSRRSRRAC